MDRQLLDDEAFRVLFERFRRALYKTCLRLTRGDEQAAEDLCQEALARAWERRHTFEGRSSFSTWLIGFATNQNRNDNRKRSELLTDDGVLDAENPDLPVLKGLTAEERGSLVQDCAEACLDEEEQRVAFLRYAGDLSYDAIAERLELPGVNAVRAILQRMRRKLGLELRARLAEMGHGTSFVRTQW